MNEYDKPVTLQVQMLQKKKRELIKKVHKESLAFRLLWPWIIRFIDLKWKIERIFERQK